MRFITSILLLFIVLSCKKQETIWTSDWNAPLINDTLSLENLVNDSTLNESLGGYYELQLDRLVYEMGINDIVPMTDTTIQETFAITVPSLSVPAGFSFVNSTEEHDLDLPGMQIRKIILSKGTIILEVKNPIATTAKFDVKLPGVSKEGIIFQQQFSAPPGTNADPGIALETIDLSGYTIDLTGVSGAEFNILQSQIDVSTIVPGPTVTMTNSDITFVNATFKDVELSYAQGYFGNQIFSDTTKIDLEALNMYQSGVLDLPNSTIQFEIENGMKVSGQGMLTQLISSNSQGVSQALIGANIGSPINIDPATGAWSTLAPSNKSIEFSNSNSNLEQYFENLGNQHEVGYSFQLNPWGNVSAGWDEIFPQSRIKVRLKANMPLLIGMDALTLRDTFEVAMNQNQTGSRIVSGEFIAHASNAFPFSAEVELYLLDEAGNLMHTVAGSEVITASQFGVYDVAYDLSISDSEVRFVLNENVISDLDQVEHIVVKSIFNSENPLTGLNEPMLIPVGAFMAIKVRTEFKTENSL